MVEGRGMRQSISSAEAQNLDANSNEGAQAENDGERFLDVAGVNAEVLNANDH